jgi:predicted metalloprotease with PDZ domain
MSVCCARRPCFQSITTYWMVAALVLGAGVAAAEDLRPPMRIEVDASEVTREIVHVRLWVPVEAGPTALVFPVWIPGHPMPENLVGGVAGLEISFGESEIEWRRDRSDMHKIHCIVPEGEYGLQLSYDIILEASKVSPQLAYMDWTYLVWYPDGVPKQEIMLQAQVDIPDDWRLGTALPIAERKGSSITFEPVTLERLLDSPILLGAHVEEIPLGIDNGMSHWLVLAADRKEALKLSETQEGAYSRLVDEAYEMFRSRPYRSYRFLYALSDHIDHGGLEHHESSMNGGPEQTFLVEKTFREWSDLLPHEFVHSWNGKYRRPSGFFRPDFHQDRDTELLWIYEGLTQYLGMVLTARSGLLSVEDTRGVMAGFAQIMASHRGRSWRSLQDMTVAARLRKDLPQEWRFWRRGLWDYYLEGALLWLEVDGVIRETSEGQRSLDDFCRSFFGGQNGAPAVAPYDLSDVIRELHAVAPFNWEGFFDERVNRIRDQAPTEGLERCGWRLTSRDTPSDGFRIAQGWLYGELYDVSIGLLIDKDGKILDVVPDSPADRACVAPGSSLRAVNGRTFSPQLLRDAIAATADGRQLRLLIEKEEFFTEYSLDYDGGARYPALERIPDRPDLLTEILSPLAREGE